MLNHKLRSLSRLLLPSPGLGCMRLSVEVPDASQCSCNARYRHSRSSVLLVTSGSPGSSRHATFAKADGSGTDQNLLTDVYRKAMGKVPQPVVVVSTAEMDSTGRKWLKRGVTCSSFTSVSLQPPIVSFCVSRPSRFHKILEKSEHFAVNVLAIDQVRYGVHFSKPAVDDENQFESVPHSEGLEGVPVLSGCSAVLECNTHSVHSVGDHYVWYGQVIGAHLHESIQQPLLYYTSSYRSVGDEIFLKAFEDATLPFEDWTHEAHLRMAWNYIQELGKDGAVPFIKKGILKYNAQNKEKIKSGYHETVTMFYIHLIAEAIQRCADTTPTFEDFIRINGHLIERSLILNYYSPERIASDESRHRFVAPDKQPLP